MSATNRSTTHMPGAHNPSVPTNHGIDASYTTNGRSTAALRDRSDSRRNVVANSTWHCGGTVTRCPVCSSLDPQCACRKEKLRYLDPQVRAQNVKAVLANTPFERMRHHRERLEAATKLFAEEDRSRARIIELTKTSLQGIMEDMFVHRDLTVLATAAMDEAHAVMCCEYQERQRLVLAKRRLIPVIALVTAQHSERLGIVCSEERAIRHLAALQSMSLDHMELLGCESARRLAVAAAEGQRRVVLRQMYMESAHIHEQSMADSAALAQAYRVGRDDLEYEHHSTLTRLREGFDAGVANIGRWVQARHQLYLQAESGFKHLLKMHSDTFNAILEVMEQELEEWTELRRQHEVQLLGIVRGEVRERNALESLEREDLSLITSEMQRDYDDRVAAHAARLAEQRSALHEAALEHAQLVALLLEALEDLHTDEQTERRLRRTWAADRQFDRAALEEEATDCLEHTFTTHTDSLSVLWEAMQDQANDVEAWIEEKCRVRDEFTEHVLSVHGSAIFAEQLELRRRMYDQMMDEEDMLWEWMDLRDTERNAAALNEMESRRTFEGAEGERRNLLYARFDAVRDAIERHERDAASARHDVECRMYEAMESLSYDESVDWELLLRLEEQSWALHYDEMCFRQIVAVDRAEENDRRALQLEWIRANEHVSRLMHHAQREMDRHVQQAWMEACEALSSCEEDSRRVLAQTARTQLELLRLDADKDFEVCTENELLRLKEERQKKEVYLHEDERLYDEREDPLEEGRMSLMEFRRSIQIETTDSSFSGRRSCGGVPATQWDDLELRREFLSGALRGYNTANLSRDAVVLLGAVMDHINETKSLKQTELRRLILEADEERKQEEKLKKELASLRETCGEYEARGKRCEEESRLRKQQHRERLAREDASIAQEERRYQENLKESKSINERIERRKDELRNGQQRRR